MICIITIRIFHLIDFESEKKIVFLQMRRQWNPEFSLAFSTMGLKSQGRLEVESVADLDLN